MSTVLVMIHIETMLFIVFDGIYHAMGYSKQIG